MKQIDKFEEDFKYESEFNIVNQASAIIRMHRELENLREENAELRESVKKYQKQNEESFKASQEIHKNWVGAVLNGDLSIKK